MVSFKLWRCQNDTHLTEIYETGLFDITTCFDHYHEYGWCQYHRKNKRICLSIKLKWYFFQRLWPHLWQAWRILASPITKGGRLWQTLLSIKIFLAVNFNSKTALTLSNLAVIIWPIWNGLMVFTAEKPFVQSGTHTYPWEYLLLCRTLYFRWRRQCGRSDGRLDADCKCTGNRWPRLGGILHPRPY